MCASKRLCVPPSGNSCLRAASRRTLREAVSNLCYVLVPGERVRAIEVLCMPASGCGLTSFALLNL
eukprot:4457957-Prymnesium_polylepis.1